MKARKPSRFKNIVIVHLNGTFWTGSGFSEEYPDAIVFEHPIEASQELKAISNSESVRIVNDYGLTTEIEL